MSGHSKWNNIKNKKGKEDAKRAQAFTKIAKYISVAVKEGGANPDFNPSLKVAIDKAKAVNMPSDNIERAIKKGAGELEGVNYEEITYEGYGGEGVAIMVHCLTDNRNRTAADVRHAFEKHGGNLGTTGSVSYMFNMKGYIVIEQDEDSPIDLDDLMLEAIDAGAEDVQGDDDVIEVITDPKDYDAVKEFLDSKGLTYAASEITYLPDNEIEVSEDKQAKIEKLIDALEELEDVQEVYHNMAE
ncbi:MAG: YebC/PmpR family DNA-binding transcriptional regulator [Ezakiella sp.]|nr:YebC/PmpR family DNA-binding transcriptional regulator [Ezakiella sp.]MDD7472068.1 YebC/PmpR family DNA-binding transcriptional regulator [Bacillota bacterium]MDY3924032.1 YebC/PmpR family DNA-binding transcriptional regulator [Ezakiella sp.]